MKLPYRFVDLDDDALKRRRRLLDSYGQFAQLSILLLPLLYQLSLGIRLLFRRLKPRKQYQPLKDHQSPLPPSLRLQRTSSSGSSLSKLGWWLGEAIAPGWETRGQCLLALSWAAWLLLFVIKDTGDDYLHVTRRFGIVAASQLPIHYLLSAKGWSPIHFLTRMSHEELNPYHRLLGRIIVTLFACHATLYLNFYVQKGILLKRIQDWDVIFGLSAITSALALFTTALAKNRDYNYRIFFYVHVILASALLPILFLHVSHVRIYVLETAAVFAGIIVQRNVAQTSTTASIKHVRDTNLLSIQIEVPKSSNKTSFRSGQHIYLGFPSLVKKLIKNPFTIVNTPKPPNGNHIELVVRSLTGTTAQLDALASRPQPIPITIEGPYGAAKYFPQFQEYDRVLLVAGGVGATFTIPLYLSLQSGVRAPPTRFVWAVRSLKETTWAPASLFEHDSASASFEIYVTGGDTSDVSGARNVPKLQRNGISIDGDDFELRSLNHPDRVDLTAEERNDGTQAHSMSTSGRPDLRSVVDETFDHDLNDKVAVLFCGPANMGASLRKEVGRWVSTGRDVFWHNEEFGW